MDTNTVITGDSHVVLEELEAESVHGVVTDPPYGLAFMGKSWDDFEPREYQEWCEVWAKKALRVLEPGGHLLAFSGNRTHHRLFTGVEDAGFEVRDTLTWHYGSGFPKGADMGKAIQKRDGVEPAEVKDADGVGFMNADDDGWNDTHTHIEMPEPEGEAKAWDGWKTQLKPATEFVVLARKPFEGATVDCVLEHGTGALNIDGCRVGTEERENAPPGENDIYCQAKGGHGSVEGRYPGNLVFDSVAAEALDQQVGELDTGSSNTDGGFDAGMYGGGDMPDKGHPKLDEGGGPSRFFYTSKASKAERTLNGRIENPHPTVKPIDLMEWLIKLVTREGQVVLDPFTGSGTTLKAAKNLNREFIGIEQSSEYADIARVRVGLTPEDPSVVRSGVNRGLEEWIA